MSLDLYGGYTTLPVPGGATGYFRLAKLGNRWVFATPLGNAYWLRGVYNASEGTLSPGVVAAKYGGDANLWATQRNRKLLAWGFNALGEYTWERGLPVGVYGSTTGNAVKLPYILLINVTVDVLLNPARLGIPERVKDLNAEVPTTTYNQYRAACVDMYDPKFAQGAAGDVAYTLNTIYGGASGGFADKPWIVGITPGDADQLFGFKSSGTAPLGAHPHPAFMAATTKAYYPGTWLDDKCYTKFAWSDFLLAKYGTIAALNTAWATGGFYTTFGTSGAYGTGTGILDEDGRHTAWMGSSALVLTGAHAAVVTDLNAFLYEMAKKVATVLVDAIRVVDTHHLIFGPAAINNHGDRARDQILLGFRDGGFQALQLNYDPFFGPNKENMVQNNETYDLTGLPAFLWYEVTAQADSPWAGFAPVYASPDFPTQAARGAHYRDVDVPAFLNARGANGDYYVVGLDWWQLTDSTAGEQTNEGLTTQKDNAYDGVEARVAAGVDAWGYPTGGEVADYGNFLGPVMAAHASIESLLLTGGGMPKTLTSDGAEFTNVGGGTKFIRHQLLDSDGITVLASATSAPVVVPDDPAPVPVAVVPVVTVS